MTSDEKEMYLMLHDWKMYKLTNSPTECQILYFPPDVSYGNFGTYYLDEAIEMLKKSLRNE